VSVVVYRHGALWRLPRYGFHFGQQIAKLAVIDLDAIIQVEADTPIKVAVVSGPQITA
jgi:hypothetical protein